MSELRDLCHQPRRRFIHLYWPGNKGYFEQEQERCRDGWGWHFVATPGHGARHEKREPERPTINFLVAGDEFALNYEQAAMNRGFHHGVVIEASFIESISRQSGFELEDVRVGHPLRFRDEDPSRYWRYDIGNRRYSALHDLRYATVVRLATPDDHPSRRVLVPNDAVVMWW